MKKIRIHVWHLTLAGSVGHWNGTGKGQRGLSCWPLSVPHLRTVGFIKWRAGRLCGWGPVRMAGCSVNCVVLAVELGEPV